jgi:LPS-assembly lipoprotein
MTARITRRGVLALTGALGAGATLIGCGFQPVYMPTASGQAGPAARDLAAINILPLGERPGMLLRQALQERLEGSGDSVARRYDLLISFSIGGEALGIQQNTTATRVRLIGRSDWVLTARDPGRTYLVAGSARAVDAVNQIDTQYFASDLESEVMQRRLADSLADQITLQIAAYFRKRAAAEATAAASATTAPASAATATSTPAASAPTPSAQPGSAP